MGLSLSMRTLRQGPEADGLLNPRAALEERAADDLG